jgi:hypothetical protein
LLYAGIAKTDILFAILIIDARFVKDQEYLSKILVENLSTFVENVLKAEN